MQPSELYSARLREREDEVALLRARERTLSIARLVAVAVAILTAAFSQFAIAIAAVVVFFVLVFVHDRAITRRTSAELSATFYRLGLDRLNDTWQGKGWSGDGYAEEHHPYAGDLDLFGRA